MLNAVINTTAATLSSLLLFLSAELRADNMIPILMYSEHIEAVSRIDQSSCDTITLYPGGNQILNEWLLLCQAFRLGGIEENFVFVPIPSQERAIRELGKGSALMAGFTLWSRQFTPYQFAQSTPILKKGEFTKALYTSMDNRGKFEHLGIDALRKRSVLVNANWSVDVDALSCFKNIYNTGVAYPNMLQMVADQKTDLILHNLSHRSDLVHKRGDIELAVVEGYLVALPDSLHFMLNKQYPNAATYFKALELGLQQLRQQKRIKRAYRSVAFFNDQTTGWKVIRCIVES